MNGYYSHTADPPEPETERQDEEEEGVLALQLLVSVGGDKEDGGSWGGTKT